MIATGSAGFARIAWYNGGMRCRVVGCGRLARRKSGKRQLCVGHQGRWQRGVRGEALNAPIREQMPKGTFTICTISGCSDRHMAKGMCATHYGRVRSGIPLDAPLTKRDPTRRYSPNPFLNRHGYLIVKDNRTGRMVMWHRIIMERLIGRPLRRDETVHHLNGDRADNRTENLELWSRSQPAGQRVADKVAWARGILELYGDSFPPEVASTGDIAVLQKAGLLPNDAT